MKEQKTNRALLIFGFCLFCLGMAAAALWDLPLNTAVYHGTWLPAVLMECFGFYPLYLPPIFLCFCFAKTKSVPRFARFLLALVGVLGGGALIVYSGIGLVQRDVLYAAALTNGFAFFFALCCAALILALRNAIFRLKMIFICTWGTVYLLCNTVVINGMKLIWNRTRFDDMISTGDFSSFTAWYHPFGAGGTSFPSGHVAAACSIFILLLCCDVFYYFLQHRGLVGSICWVYIIWMALCRIVIGRHYLSDTLMAAFVMTLLFYAMTHNRFYCDSLTRLRQKTQMEAF